MSNKNKWAQKTPAQPLADLRKHMAASPLNLDTPVCPSVLPLNPASLREIDGVAMETPPLARPVAWLDLKPNGDGKPPAKSGATLARNLLSPGFCIEVLAQFWSHFQKSGWIYVNAHSRRGQNPPLPHQSKQG